MAMVCYHTSDAKDDKLDDDSIELPSNGGRMLVNAGGGGDYVVLVTKRIYYGVKVRPYAGDGSPSAGNVFYTPYDSPTGNPNPTPAASFAFNGDSIYPTVLLAPNGDEVLLRTSQENNRKPAWIFSADADVQIEIRPCLAHQ